MKQLYKKINVCQQSSPPVAKHIIKVVLLLMVWCSITIPSFAQNRTITGTVTDKAQGLPIPGVSVKLKNDQRIVVTGTDGKYSFSVPQGLVVLQFIYVGFVTQEVTVTGAVQNIALAEDKTDLDEVVIVGYGSQKKATLTGAINTVKAEEILKSPTSNLTNSLAGRLPGVTVIQQNGQPGLNSANITVRGVGTYSGNTSAIVFVDGIERATFGDIDPNEIETISVLKDASSTAVFGIRGANGVILVTTKSGKEGKPRISYTGNASIQTYAGIPKQLNAFDNATLMNEAMVNDNLTPRWSAAELQKFKDGSDPYGYPDVNWFDYVTRNSYPQTQHNINVSGGTKLVKYYASVGYLFEDGIFKDLNSIYGYKTTNNYSRYNFRSNVDLNLVKDLVVSIRLGGRLGKRYQPAGPAASSFGYDHLQGIISRILQTPAFAYPISLPDGKIAGNTDVGTNVWNPYGVLTRWGTRNDENNAIESSFTANYKLDKLVKGLSVKGLFGYDSYFNGITRRSAWWAEYLYDRVTGEVKLAGNSRDREEPLGALSAEYSGNIVANTQLGINYDRTFGKHAVSGLLLATRTLNRIKGAAGTLAAPEASQGMVARATYNYGERYFAEFNMGYNGSEQFYGSKAYGYFPAFSAGWTLTNESFMKSVKWLNYLKIRGSYGKVGNDKLGSDRFLYLTNYQTVAGGVTFGNPGSTTSRRIVNIAQLGLEDVTWETAIKRNIGIETKFLRNRLQFNVDLYDEDRDGILTVRSASQGSGLVTFGTDYPSVNVGKVYNKGYEIELGFNDKVRDFGYGINTQLSFNRNRIITRDEPAQQPEYQKMEGKRVGQFFGYVTDGFFTSAEDINEYKKTIVPIGNVIPGDLKYKDMNGDGKITTEDKVAIGYSRTPEYTFSITPSVSYKTLSLSVMFQGVTNVSSDVILTEQNNGFQMYEFQLDRWTPATAATATWPALHYKGNAYTNYQLNDYILQDASYIKLRNVEVSYGLPQKWIRPLKLTSARIFFSGQNLYTWTKFKMYLDPEQVNTYNTEFSKQSIYPTSRIYNFGVNIQL